MRYLYAHPSRVGCNLWSREYSSVTEVASVVMVNNGHGDMVAIRNTDGQFESLSSEELEMRLAALAVGEYLVLGRALAVRLQD